jgi:hypothetical protein
LRFDKGMFERDSSGPAEGVFESQIRGKELF